LKMNILKKCSVVGAVLLCSGASFAQGQPSMTDPAAPQNNENAVNTSWKPSLVKDGVIDAVPHVNRALELNNIREVDAAWKRRVWRVIDVRQKQNQPFIYMGDEYSGGGAFIEILIDAVKKGKIFAYSNIDDRFTTPLNMESFERTIGGTKDTVWVENPDTGEQTMKIVDHEFDPTSVTTYRIKEDWIFDRNLGRMVIRIVGIAPLIDQKSETTGDILYTSPMFWLSYPELRSKVLVNYEIYNPQNDLHRMSWADYLDGRYFASYVIKTSANNPTGADMGRGLRALEEGERAIEVMREKEDDMWQK
jgi:gliding motility associated protien GldN